MKPTADDVWRYYDRHEIDESDRPSQDAVRERLDGYELPEVVATDEADVVNERTDECVEVFYDPKGETPNVPLGNAWDAVIWDDGEVVEAKGFFEGVEAAAEHALVLAEERSIPVVRTTSITNTPTFDD